MASGGGHWVQLMRLRLAFSNADTTYVTVRNSYREDVPGEKFRVVTDATRWNKFRMVVQILQITWILLRVRPDYIVTTGAAPGYWALRIGKMLGADTCWIDSIANIESISMAGSMAGKHADLWLTQWKGLANQNGPKFSGSVIDE